MWINGISKYREVSYNNVPKEIPKEKKPLILKLCISL